MACSTFVGDAASEPSPPKNGGRLNVDAIRCGELLMPAEEFPGPLTGFLVVADGVGQYGGVHDGHLLDRRGERRDASWSRSP